MNQMYQSLSEWLLSNANSAMFQLYQWEDDKIRFVLHKHAELDLYNASSLKQQSGGRHVAQLGHIILIPSQPVFTYSP